MLHDLEVVSMLGPCFNFVGVVLLARRNAHLLALKKLDLEKASATDFEAMQKDLYLTRQLQHTNVLSIDSLFVENFCLYVVTPVAGYGSCADLVTNHFACGLVENAIGIILRDVLAGLAYLHSRRYIHRALRGRHILVTSSGRAQITSLRHAESFVPHEPIHVLSVSDADNLNWLAPEVLAQDADGYDEKSDIYSVGMTILELKNGFVPFSDVCSTLMLVEKLRGCLPTFVTDVSAALNQVFVACTLHNPDLRPSAKQLLTLPFMKVKGDLSTLLHPVIPLTSEQVHADLDDLRTILSNSHKMAEISIDHTDWIFE